MLDDTMRTMNVAHRIPQSAGAPMAILVLMDRRNKTVPSPWPPDVRRQAAEDASAALSARYAVPSRMEHVEAASCFGRRMRASALACTRETRGGVAACHPTRLYGGTLAYLWGLRRAAAAARFVLHLDDDFRLNAHSEQQLLQRILGAHRLGGLPYQQPSLWSRVQPLLQPLARHRHVAAFIFEPIAKGALSCATTAGRVTRRTLPTMMSPSTSCTCRPAVWPVVDAPADAPQPTDAGCYTGLIFCPLRATPLMMDNSRTCALERHGFERGYPHMSVQAFLGETERLLAMWPLAPPPTVQPFTRPPGAVYWNVWSDEAHIELLYEEATRRHNFTALFLDPMSTGLYKCESSAAVPGGCRDARRTLHARSLSMRDLKDYPRARAGHCGLTRASSDNADAQCAASAQSGSVPLGRGMRSLDECVQWCSTRCAQCRFVSLSYATGHTECGWYSRCNVDALSMSMDGDSYLTVEVRTKGLSIEQITEDEATTLGAALLQPLANGSCYPRLYVYSLPEGYRDRRTQRPGRNDVFGRVAVRSAQMPPSFPVGVDLWDTSMNGLGDLFYERALSYHCREHDPEKADLFFVPAYTQTIYTERERLGKEPLCAETPFDAASGADPSMPLFERLHAVTRRRKPLPHLLSSTIATKGPGIMATAVHRGDHGSSNGDHGSSNGDLTRARSPADDDEDEPALYVKGGADHFFLNPREGGWFESRVSCELDLLLELRLGRATRLSMIEAIPQPMLRPYDWQPERQYRSIPFPSLVHLTPHAQGLPWASRHERHILVSGSFSNTTGERTEERSIPQLRTALREMCKAAAQTSPTACVFLDMDADRFYRGSSGEDTYRRLARTYYASTFCLQPPGDDIGRKGIVDALLLGCIPVLFHSGQSRLWPWHWGRWVRNASYTFPYDAVVNRRVSPIEALRKLPSERVAVLQETIRANAHRLQYSAVDTRALGSLSPGPDAFDIAITSAARLAHSRSSILAGRARQRHFFAGHRGGYCGYTDGPGDCSARGRAGHVEASGTWQPVHDLASCEARCRACAACNYVSFNQRSADCSWYHACDMRELLARDGGGDYLTVKVSDAVLRE